MSSILHPKPVIVGYRYFMTLQMGLCRGPIDEIVQINVADVRAWPVPDGHPNAGGGLVCIAQGPDDTGVKLFENGDYSTVTSDHINTYLGPTNGIEQIDAPNLFGGDKREGGIKGKLSIFMGAATQTIPTYIKTMLGGRVPDFRGLVTLWYDGLLCSLNPYPKTWTVRVRRTVSGWDGEVWEPTLATIWMGNGTIKAMNPAHIIYECLTNRDWGRSFPRAFIGSSFAVVAQTLFDENFGLCLRWNRQDDLSDFIQEVIDHIGGSFYVDRTTGLLEMSLLRDDYDPDLLLLFTYDTGLISLEEDETVARDDLTNEVIINWHDPLKNKDRQVRMHNLAGVQSIGATKTSTTTYDGLPTAKLALRVAQRDLKAATNSLKRYKITLDRRARAIIPGSVFKIQALDKGIGEIILRAGKVSNAGGTSGAIAVEAVIDVFGLPSSTFVSEQPSEWIPPDRTPVVASKRFLREATYGDFVQSLSSADLAAVDVDSSAVATIVARPSTASQSYRIASRIGSAEYKVIGSGVFAPYAEIVGDIGPYDTTVTFDNGIDLGLVTVGGAVQIESEIVRLDDITSDDGISGTMTIARGCVDTIPHGHLNGTGFFFIDGAVGSDGLEYTLAEDVDVKIITVTSTQELDIALAPADTVNIKARQGRPWPPGKVLVNGTPFGSLGTQSFPLVLTWTHRDRLLIQDQLVEHGASSSGPEAGTTYSVRVYDDPSDVTANRTVDSIAGTTWTYTSTMAAADGITSQVVFELESSRDGVTSLAHYRFAVSV